MTGWQKMKFLRAVFEGGTLTARAAVTGERRDGDGTRLELEVWVENAQGEMTAAGWASARI